MSTRLNSSHLTLAGAVGGGDCGTFGTPNAPVLARRVRTRLRPRTVSIMFAVLSTGCAAAEVTEIKVLSAVAVKSALDDLAPEFERSTGYEVTISYATAGELRKRIEEGDFGDVTILPRPTFEPLLTRGMVISGSIATLARSTVGVSVRAGRSKPDISWNPPSRGRMRSELRITRRS